MSRRTDSERFGRMCLVLLGWMLAAWPAVALGQEELTLPPLAARSTAVPPLPGASQELLQRLGKLEERLDALTKQNEARSCENQMPAKNAESTASQGGDG